MPLPIIFGLLGNPNLGQLDTNFAVVGLLGNQGCTVAGTNTLVLTPATTNPTVSAYANYLVFTAIAAHTNTGAVTAQVGSLAALNVYKDSSSGPAVLSGSEIIASNYFELVYDSTLNSSAGGFHLRSSGSGTGSPISPSSVTTTTATIGTLDVTGGASIASVASVGTLVVNAGAPLTRLLTSSTTVTFTVLPANSSQDVAVAVSGVQVGDAIAVGPPTGPATGLVLQGRVTAAGTVTLRALNVTGSSITALTGIYRLVAFGFT